VGTYDAASCDQAWTVQWVFWPKGRRGPRWSLPFLLHGQDSFAQPYDSSLLAILPRLGIDGPVVTVLRGLVLAATIAVAVLRWRQGGEERLRIVETSAVLMLGTFLVLSPTFLYYPLLVVPALAASIAVPGSVARSIWYWLASLLLLDGAVRIYHLDFATPAKTGLMQAYKGTAWIVAVGLLVLVKVVHGMRKPAEPVKEREREPQMADRP
jgi:hypothetical protein